MKKKVKVIWESATLEVTFFVFPSVCSVNIILRCSLNTRNIRYFYVESVYLSVRGGAQNG